MANEIIVLDPSEVATARTELSINSGAIQVRAEGVSWGNSEIQAYMSQQQRGESPVDFRIPNRQIEIPLVMQTSGTVTFPQARSKLAAKVARIQQEGGWLKRVTSGGGTLFCDLVNASLNLPGGWLQAHREVETEAVLTLEAIPDFYGAEVTLSDHVETSAAELSFTETQVKGDYPGRVRIVVDDDQGVNKRGLIWSVRSRHYSAAATAAQSYEAEALNPLDTATATSKAGASNGSVVIHSLLSQNWTPVLSTNIGGATWLTHTGSYRVFARVWSTNGTAVESRFVYDVGDFAYPHENEPVRLYDGGTFHILDYGQIRLDPPSVGTHRWQGQFQARGELGTEGLALDKVWIVNTDEGHGVLRAPIGSVDNLGTYSARSDFNTESGTLGGDSLAIGGTWVGAGDADEFSVTTVGGVNFAQRTAVSDASITAGRYITASTPTLTAGVAQVTFTSSALAPGSIPLVGSYGVLSRSAGTSDWLFFGWNSGALYVAKRVSGTATNMAVTMSGNNYFNLAGVFYTYRLFVDAAGFWSASVSINGGAFFEVLAGYDTALGSGGALQSGKVGFYDVHANATAATRLYSSFAAWAPTADAVAFASQSAQLTTDGLVREDSAGAAYAPISYPTGDLPRIPPATLEGRTTEFFIKMTRGDLQTLADPGIDDLSARVSYRPSYLLVPET